MGLDMFLKARRYASEYNDAKLARDVAEAAGLSKYSDSVSVDVEIGYWRKANAVHAWFVDNAQKGVDDCRDAHVTREQLRTLRDLCVETLATRDSDLLAPRGGFFFGSLTVDEYYWEDIAKTRDILTNALEDPSLKNCDFYYSSSW